MTQTKRIERPEPKPERVDEFVELVDHAIGLLHRASRLTRADKSPGGVIRNDRAFENDGPEIRRALDRALDEIRPARRLATARGYDLHRARSRPTGDHPPTFDASGFSRPPADDSDHKPTFDASGFGS